MFGRMARFFIVPATYLALGCSPNLGDVPFACDREGLCPEGYSCQSTVCVRDGVRPDAVRPSRATWINPPEMFWFASSDGGATLLINDNFTQGRKGIYDIRVAADGTVSEPRMLLPQDDGPAVASSIVLLPDGRYGIVTLSFPDIDGDQMVLELFGVERDVTSGTTAGVEKWTLANTLYLGGVEPPYVSAVIAGSIMHVAWTVPSSGGMTEVLRIERQGSLWTETSKTTAQLPANIPPLSGDCQLFRDDSGFMTVRLGFENYALATIDPMSMMATFVPTTDEHMFVWKTHEFLIRRTNDEVAGTSQVAYVMKDKMSGMETSKTFPLRDITSPFVGVPFNGGALVAPVSSDPSSPSVDVAWQSPTEPFRIVASVPRESTEPLYAARSFVRDNKAYVVWTEFHDANMDVWVGVTDFVQSGAKPLVHKAMTPRRIFTIPRRNP